MLCKMSFNAQHRSLNPIGLSLFMYIIMAFLFFQLKLKDNKLQNRHSADNNNNNKIEKQNIETINHK